MRRALGELGAAADVEADRAIEGGRASGANVVAALSLAGAERRGEADAGRQGIEVRPARRSLADRDAEISLGDEREVLRAAVGAGLRDVELVALLDAVVDEVVAERLAVVVRAGAHDRIGRLVVDEGAGERALGIVDGLELRRKAQLGCSAILLSEPLTFVKLMIDAICSNGCGEASGLVDRVLPRRTTFSDPE